MGNAPSNGGRVSLAFSGPAGPPVQVRFRVIAESPTNTRIGIESATATDVRGASIAIGAPRAHEVAIVAKVAN